MRLQIHIYLQTYLETVTLHQTLQQEIIAIIPQCLVLILAESLVMAARVFALLILKNIELFPKKIKVVVIKNHVVSDAQLVSEVRGIANRVGNVTTILTYTCNYLF
jgi:hypothetical protein